MKHRKARFALILAFLLLLGTLPAQALEPEVGSLHDQWEKTEKHLQPGRNPLLSNLFTDDGQLVTEAAFTVELDGLSWGWETREGEEYLRIDTGDAVPGGVYTLAATRRSDGRCFSMPLIVELPELGLYRQQERSLTQYLTFFDDVWENGKEKCRTKLNYAQNGLREAYLLVDGSITELSELNGDLTAELSENGVKISLPEGVVSGVHSAGFRAKTSYGREYAISVVFSDGTALTTSNGAARIEAAPGRRSYQLFTEDGAAVTAEEFDLSCANGISVWLSGTYAILETGSLPPGTDDTLTAVRKSDGAVFTIPVAVVLPEYGFYSGPTATNESFLMTADTWKDNVINYRKSGRELYLVNLYNDFERVTSDSSVVSAELLENRAVKLVLSEEVTEGSRSAALQVEMPGRTETFSLLFTDGKGLVTRNNKTKWEIEAGGYGWTQLFTMENETVTADGFTLSSQIGAAVRLYTDSVSYNASSLRPGMVDVLTATRIADSETFTMPVEITLPYYGFYSGEEATNESFLCAAGSSLAVPFRYDPEDPQPVYYRSKNAAIVAASIDSPALTASVTASGAVRIALAEGVTRGNDLGVLHFSTEYGSGTRSLIFTDGTLMLCGSSTIASSLPRERNELKLYDLDGAPVTREEYPTLRISGDGLGTAAWEGETPVWSGAAETGTGTLTAVSADGSRSLTLFLKCELPNNGFYDAPERSAAHYLSRGTSYTGQYDEENGRQIYYFGQASASDLSFRSANSGDGRVSAAPYGDGACLAIALSGSVQEQTVETQIQYSGVNGYGSNWPGTLNVRFVPAVTHRHELEWVNETEADCTYYGHSGFYQCRTCGYLFSGPLPPYGEEEVLTRAKLAQILVTALGWPAATIQNPFTDVNEPLPEYGAILSCTQRGVMAAPGEGLFQPGAMLTGYQAAGVVLRAIGENWSGGSNWQIEVAKGIKRHPELFRVSDGNQAATVGFLVFNALLTYGEALGNDIRWTPPLGHLLEHVNGKAANFSHDGNLEYWFCGRCGRYFADAEAQRELALDQVKIPSFASGILRTEQASVVAAEDRVTVSLPLENVTGQTFRGRVLAAVFLGERFLGSQLLELELQPGEKTAKTMEIQISEKPGRSDSAVVRFFLVDTDFAPVAGTKVLSVPRLGNDEVYNAALGRFSELLTAAENPANAQEERFVKMAKAEAELLDSAVMIPTTTQGGTYTISRVAPRTVPYVRWGNDDDRWFGLVISGDDFLTPVERDELLAAWNVAVAGGADYDPAAILTAKGHTLATDYTSTFTTAPVTLDWLSTGAQADTGIPVQTVSGLVQYDNLNRLQPMLAERWDVSDDGLTYTFHIRPGVHWYSSEGVEVAEVTAQDFVAGFHHMLDAQAGLEWLAQGVVAGVGEYLYKGGSFENVGYAAPDRYTLVVTLERPTSYFLGMLTYSCFLPICGSFYQAHGGVYGIGEYNRTCGDPAYTFGRVGDVSSQVYCGPFLLRKLQQNSEILVVRNENFFQNDKTTLNSIQWVYDAGENPTATYNNVVAGVYASTGLTAANGTLDLAKADGNFDQYAFVSETSSTTYFGALNLNRGSYALWNGAVASPQTPEQRESTHTALQNKAFRQALQFAFDKGTYNAASRGEELKNTNLRNMLCAPDFVSLERAVTLDGKTFPAGTFYGEMVQYFLEQLGNPIRVDDQIDGWYNPEAARARLTQAKRELGDTVSWPIQIDVVYYRMSDTNTAQAQAYKAGVEATLGAENVRVNLVAADNSSDYYASGYRASTGRDCDYDMFYGSGWGPDYGDPSSYLDIFLRKGYMVRTFGID